MTEPLQAIVDSDRTVTGVVVMDHTTVGAFRDLGFLQQLWPDSTLHDITTTDPRPGIGWSHHPGTEQVWRPPSLEPARP